MITLETTLLMVGIMCLGLAAGPLCSETLTIRTRLFSWEKSRRASPTTLCVDLQRVQLPQRLRGLAGARDGQNCLPGHANGGPELPFNP